MYQIEVPSTGRVWKTLSAEDGADAERIFDSLIERKFPELKPLIERYGRVALCQAWSLWDGEEDVD